MTVRSMTGFGQGSAETAELRVSVELRGVNNRFTDTRFRIPSEFSEGEAEIRRRILRRVRRGRVEVNISVEAADPAQTRQCVNRALLQELVGTANQVGREFALAGELDLMGVLSLPGMLKTEGMELTWGGEQQDVLLRALDTAVEAFDADRVREGEVLREELVGRFDEMRRNALAARTRAEVVPGRLRDKLLQRLEALTGSLELDPARVAQEAAVLADKSDVTEELVRLEGHLGQAAALLGQPGGEPLGKRLEFLLQEIHREANTVCSKASDLELTRHALAIKLGVEKAREQVQNLE